MPPTPPPRVLLAVFCGGALGTLVRAVLEEAFAPAAGAFPWTTFAVNLAGAFLLGALIAHAAARPPASATRTALLGPGLCGGLTTFSTLQLELFRLLDGGHVALAAAYATASVAGGLALALLGMRLVERRFGDGDGARLRRPTAPPRAGEAAR